MTAERRLICAIYTRKSTEEGLDQNFNSLDAQRDACENYIASQKSEGWLMARERYDDGGFSGGNMERPSTKSTGCHAHLPTLPSWSRSLMSTR
jgi:site-specific DNA recombinase